MRQYKPLYYISSLRRVWLEWEDCDGETGDEANGDGKALSALGTIVVHVCFSRFFVFVFVYMTILRLV